MEEELRRESEKTRKAEDHGNNVLSWGVGMYDHYTGIQKLLETLATAQGVPINEIPPPPVPPPARSLSPPRPTNILETSEEPLASCAQQHGYNDDNVTLDACTQDLNVQPEGPVAEGMFGGFFSASETNSLSLSLLLGSQPLDL